MTSMILWLVFVHAAGFVAQPLGRCTTRRWSEPTDDVLNRLESMVGPEETVEPAVLSQLEAMVGTMAEAVEEPTEAATQVEATIEEPTKAATQVEARIEEPAETVDALPRFEETMAAGKLLSELESLDDDEVAERIDALMQESLEYEEAPSEVAVLTALEEAPMMDAEEWIEEDEEMKEQLDVLQDAPPAVEEEETEVDEKTQDLLEEWMAGMPDMSLGPDPRLGKVSSHALVEVDEDGDPLVDRDRMVFVDEATCIGCTNCACIAPQTFMMEDDHGRARVYSQEGDTADTIAEAIATCPVDCIHYVPWDELVALEEQRDRVMHQYNFKGRLVGNDGFLSTNGAGEALLDISSNKASRCPNCPSNKCIDCPMFSVGDDAVIATKASRKQCGNCPVNGCIGCPLAAANPEHQKRRARREVKRRQRTRAQQDEIREEVQDIARPLEL